MYLEVERLSEEMFAESKALTKALHPKWQGLKELWRSRRINWKRYEEEGPGLRPGLGEL